MTTANSSRNKQNYLAAKAAFNARDLNRCVSYYAPDHRMASQSGQPAPSIRLFFEQTIATWPDIRIDVAHAVAEDEWVTGRSIAVATHVNRVMGVDATHKKVETVFWDMHRFNEDGLMVETWNLMDGVSIMRRLGLLPPPT